MGFVTGGAVTFSQGLVKKFPGHGFFIVTLETHGIDPLGFQIKFIIAPVGVVARAAFQGNDRFMDIFSFPVLIVAVETKFPLLHQFEFVLADFIMAPDTVIVSGEMQFFQLFKFRMAFCSDAIVCMGC